MGKSRLSISVLLQLPALTAARGERVASNTPVALH